MIDHSFHTVNAYLALIVGVVNFVYTIFILARTSLRMLYITFLFICVANMFWNLGDFMIYMTGQGNWFYFSRIGSSMLPGLMFHFITILVRPEKKIGALVYIGYLLSGLLSLVAFLAILYPWPRPFMDSNLRNITFLALLGPFLLMGVWMLLLVMWDTTLGKERERLGYFLAAAIVGVLAAFAELLQFLKTAIPPLGHIGSLVYSSILAIGVFKHRADYDILAQMKNRLEDLSQMAAGIAHEIRNPLTSIKGASTLLGKELQNMDYLKCREYHDLIMEEIDRITNILSNFQDFTRPPAIEKESVAINDVIQKTVNLAQMGNLNSEIRLELLADLPMVQADASLMRQVFLNVIKNASEACGSGGELVIRTERFPHFVKIIFSDNGPGIPSDLLHHIFQPFFTTKKTGMGMGLAITQKIIEAHDGRIEVTNLLPKGTQFSIFLPIWKNRQI